MIGKISVVTLLLVVLVECQLQCTPASLGYGEEYFKLILSSPTEQRLSQTEAKNYADPGWQIHDSRNRPVIVRVDYKDMRKGIPGRYELVYRAFLEDASGEPTGNGIGEPAYRYVEVYDIDECAEGLHYCSAHATCRNTIGSYECICNPGYRGDGRVCYDIDECADGTHGCSQYATCYNVPGSYNCVCNQGFIGDGRTCNDIDECALGTDDCSEFAECRNTPGRYECKCRKGYEGNGRQCTPVNVCAQGQHNCHYQAICLVRPDGGFECRCREGFYGDGVTSCEDVNECELNTHNCPAHSLCVNTIGSYQCNCIHGFEKKSDGTCVDVNECLRNTYYCPQHSTCFNTVGGYECKCHEGYKFVNGICESINDGGPKFFLQGGDRIQIPQFTSFKEPGVRYADEKDPVNLDVKIPSELEGIARKCGDFPIKYTVTDSLTGRRASKTRIVEVTPVDQCLLTDGSEFAARCHPYASCIFVANPSQHDCHYRCQCKEGYKGNGIGVDGCVDALPPTLIYNGPNPYEIIHCIVCGEAISTPDLRQPIITKALDYTPYGKSEDVSDRITLTTEPSHKPNCLIHNYRVTDLAGNEATRSVTVCLKIEDMRTTIMEMKALYSWQIWIIKNIAYACFVIFAIFCVWEFGHYVAACFRVLLSGSKKPSWEDFNDAYSVWFRILHPFSSQNTIRTLVHKKVPTPYF